MVVMMVLILIILTSSRAAPSGSAPYSGTWWCLSTPPTSWLGYNKHKVEQFKLSLQPARALLTDWFSSSSNTNLSLEMIIAGAAQQDRRDRRDQGAGGPASPPPGQPPPSPRSTCPPIPWLRPTPSHIISHLTDSEILPLNTILLSNLKSLQSSYCALPRPFSMMKS